MTKSAYLRKAREQFLHGIGVPEREEFVADAFQQEAINAVVESQDTLVVAPTGSGKTYIALQAIDAVLSLGGKAVYTTPLKALSNTKYTELKKKFEPAHKVGLLTGDRKIDTDADLVVATTEIYRNELYRATGRFSLVVLDEVHFIADPQRGPVWEESIILTPSSSTLLMLSATISNPFEIAEWIHEVRGKECRVVLKRERPVELRLGFLHPEYGAIPLRNEDGGIFNEVSDFYGRMDLDPSGMRLRGGRSNRSGGPNSRGPNSRGPRSRGPRSKFRGRR